MWSYSPIALGKRLDDARLRDFASNYGKNPAQAIIRWHVQHGFVPISRSLTRSHIKETAAFFDFEPSRAEMDAMDGWNEDF